MSTPHALRQLSFRHFKLVSVLGQELNLTRAAELLHTTQPAVSRSLAQLEDIVGKRLFNRSTKRITLTAAGVVVMQHANRMLNELSLIEESLAGLQEGATGEVRIGALTVFSSDLIARTIAQARQMAPKVVFSVEMMRVHELYDALLAGRIDLMLSHTEFEMNLNTVKVHELYAEQAMVLMAAAHPLASRPAVSRSELAQYPWVLPAPETPLRRQINRMLSIHRTDTDAVLRDVQTESLLVASSLVRQGDMIWAIASRVAQQLGAAGGLCAIPLEPPLLAGPMCAFHLRHADLAPAGKLFLTHLHNLALEWR